MGPGEWRNDYEERAGAFNIGLPPNGKIVASRSPDGKVRLWDVETEKVVARHTDIVRSVVLEYR